MVPAEAPRFVDEPISGALTAGADFIEESGQVTPLAGVPPQIDGIIPRSGSGPRSFQGAGQEGG